MFKLSDDDDDVNSCRGNIHNTMSQTLLSSIKVELEGMDKELLYVST
jgi:hypothetical protein